MQPKKGKADGPHFATTLHPLETVACSAADSRLLMLYAYARVRTWLRGGNQTIDCAEINMLHANRRTCKWPCSCRWMCWLLIKKRNALRQLSLSCWWLIQDGSHQPHSPGAGADCPRWEKGSQQPLACHPTRKQRMLS